MSENTVTKRKVNKSNSSPEEIKKQDGVASDKEKPKFKYGPMPRFPGQRIWGRAIMIFGVLIYVWYTSKNTNEKSLAKQSEIHERRGQSLECDKDYLEEIMQFPGCKPMRCGRYISDKIVTSSEVDVLLNVARKGMNFAGSDGGATILDLHSGALSYKDKFVNIYASERTKGFITPADLVIYKNVRIKIQEAIAEYFGLDKESLFLTHPTFMSRLNNAEPKTLHDEYWHKHVDKETYGSFHYTSLLYLNDFGIDFRGGRFVFLKNMEYSYKNITVEPRKGRVSIFTSGAENPHLVERVTQGNRFAITVSFTCDKSKAIADPTVAS